jgi:hypothetical protein
MTPLAHRIVRELTLPLKRRTFEDGCGLLSRMSDVHCFDVSEVYEAARDLVVGSAAEIPDTEIRGQTILQRAKSISEVTSFLPAPKTWLEWTNDVGGRSGVLLTEDGDWVRVRLAQSGGELFCSGEQQYRLSLSDPSAFQASKDGPMPDDQVKPELASLMLRIHGFLAMINTPRIIGRRQHMPHRGLERDLVRAMKSVGKFPLHAWTEIKLEVAAPRDMTSDGEHEAHLTGKRALHFCRAHLRIKLGRLEIVRAHWRGDGSLGIKQSRYKLVPPRKGGCSIRSSSLA